MSGPNDDIPPVGDLSEEPDGAPLVIDGVADAHATLENVFILATGCMLIWSNLELKGVAMPEEVGEERWDQIVDARGDGRAGGLVGERRRGVEHIQQGVFGYGRAVVEDVHRQVGLS